MILALVPSYPFVVEATLFIATFVLMGLWVVGLLADRSEGASLFLIIPIGIAAGVFTVGLCSQFDGGEQFIQKGLGRGTLIAPAHVPKDVNPPAPPAPEAEQRPEPTPPL